MNEITLFWDKISNSLLSGEVAHAAWSGFYDRYQRLITAAVKHCGLSGPDARDVSQETWIDLLRHLSQLRNDESPKRLESWTLQAVHSKVMDHFRSRSRQPAVSLDDPMASCQAPASAEEDAPEADERNRRRDLVRAALARLRGGPDDLNFEIQQRRHMQGMTTADVARELHLRPDQVCDRLRRADDKLRKALEGDLGRGAGGGKPQSQSIWREFLKNF